jgi:hypothetical protein
MGVRGCGWSNSSKLMNSAPNSASVADDITAFIISEIFSMAPMLIVISSVLAIPAVCFWFGKIGCVAMNRQFHIACLVSYDKLLL